MEIKLSNFKGEATLFGRTCVVEFTDGKLSIASTSEVKNPLTGEDAADIIAQLQQLALAGAPAETTKPAPKLASVPAQPKPAAPAAPAPAAPKAAAPAAAPAATKPAAPAAPKAVSPANGAAKPAAPAAAPKPTTATSAAKPAAPAAAKPPAAAAPKPAAVKSAPKPPPPTEVIEETVGEDAPVEEAPVEEVAAAPEAAASSDGWPEVGDELTQEQLDVLNGLGSIRDVIIQLYEWGWHTQEQLEAVCTGYQTQIKAATRVLDIPERVSRCLTVIGLSDA